MIFSLWVNIIIIKKIKKRIFGSSALNINVERKTHNDPKIDDKEEYLKIKRISIQVIQKIIAKLNDIAKRIPK